MDDDDALRDALCGFLMDEGFEVVGNAADGSTAVSLTRNREPDVVLVDYRMSGMDGLEAISMMETEAPLLQAVMLTAYDDETLILKAERPEVYCLLVKGCSPTLILDVVLRAPTYKRELEAHRR